MKIACDIVLKPVEAHSDCINLCRKTGLFATLPSPIDSLAMKNVEKKFHKRETNEGSGHNWREF